MNLKIPSLLIPIVIWEIRVSLHELMKKSMRAEHKNIVGKIANAGSNLIKFDLFANKFQKNATMEEANPIDTNPEAIFS